jgi:hypothetical protein
MKRFLVAATLSCVVFTASALPTVNDVQAEVAKGNYVQAEVLMSEVVAAKPDSARGHYVYAEILAHEKRFSKAAEELARAKAIDPQHGFAAPEKFLAFEQLLQREQAAERATPSSRAPVQAVRELPPVERGSGVPGWVWALGAAGLALVAWRALAPKSQNAVPGGYSPAVAGGVPSTGYAQPAPGGGYAPGYPAPAPAGNGLLHTGLAVAGGVAAGMLAEKLLNEHTGGSAGGFSGSSGGLGSTLADDRPLLDKPAARELEDRPVDFGNGDGWVGGDGAAGGEAPASDDGW